VRPLQQTCELVATFRNIKNIIALLKKYCGSNCHTEDCPLTEWFCRYPFGCRWSSEAQILLGTLHYSSRPRFSPLYVLAEAYFILEATPKQHSRSQ